MTVRDVERGRRKAELNEIGLRDRARFNILWIWTRFRCQIKIEALSIIDDKVKLNARLDHTPFVGIYRAEPCRLATDRL